jgi:hypothetical protein
MSVTPVREVRHQEGPLCRRGVADPDLAKTGRRLRSTPPFTVIQFLTLALARSPENRHCQTLALPEPRTDGLPSPGRDPVRPAPRRGVSDLRDFIATSASSTIVIDIPIGLVDSAERGGRECDRLVRGELGRPRGSSVFPTPVRGVLAAQSHQQASN